MRETGRQLRHRFELTGTHVQILEPLLVRDIGKDGRRDAHVVRFVAAEERDGDAELQLTVIQSDSRFRTRRSGPRPDRTFERHQQVRCGTAELGANGASDLRFEIHVEQRTGGLIRVAQNPGGVDRHHAAADVVEHIGRLQSLAPEGFGQHLGTRTRLPQPRTDVARADRHRREIRHLQPRRGVQHELARDDDFREVERAHQQRGDQAATARDEQRRVRDDEDVKGRELRLAATRDMHQRRDEGNVGDRLPEQEPATRPCAVHFHRNERDTRDGESHDGGALYQPDGRRGLAHRQLWQHDDQRHRQHGANRIHPQQRLVRIENGAQARDGRQGLCGVAIGFLHVCR